MVGTNDSRTEGNPVYALSQFAAEYPGQSRNAISIVVNYRNGGHQEVRVHTIKLKDCKEGGQ